MKQMSFRPFRRVGDKLVITSYMGWRKIYTANYNGAIVKLLPFPEIKKDEVIYAMGDPNGDYNFWHPTKFEPLFWPLQHDEVYSQFDCDGCPCFSHKTAIYVSENYSDKIHLWEPLAASIVYFYFEKMRDELKNISWVK